MTQPAKRKFCEKYNCALVRYVALSTMLSVPSAYVFQPRYHDNSDAATILATVLSILAGFLIAVMAIVSDERALRGKNWRQDTFYMGEVRRQLVRHRMMFYLYLGVLVLIFIGSLKLEWWNWCQVWCERSMLFLAMMALLLSFRLPGELTTRQMDLLQNLIAARKAGRPLDDDKP